MHNLFIRRPIVVSLLALVVFLAVLPPTSLSYAQQLIGSFADIGISIVQRQAALCALCAVYYKKFNEWPSNRQEFESCFLNFDEESKKAAFSLIQKYRGKEKRLKYSHEAFESQVKSFFDSVKYNFLQLDNGDLLLEGDFSGSGGRFFSVVCHKSEGGFSFIPSKKPIKFD